MAFVTAEKRYDHQREKIENTFRCQVANGYGGRDAGFIAHECLAGGMHITAEDVVVEILDSEGCSLAPGAAAEVVITHLATADFPIIHYRKDDIVVLDDQTCSCGRNLPMLREIQWRTTDFLVFQDDTLMRGLALIYTIDDLQGINRFKIIQETLNWTRNQLVTDEYISEASVTTILNVVRRRLGQSIKVDLERVSNISTEASGKLRYVAIRVAMS